MKSIIGLASVALAGEHFIIVDPSKFDACNALQARFAMTKMVALLFNSDSLSGNTMPTHEALKDPNVWRRVNSLSPTPRGGFLDSHATGRNDCDDVDTLIEVATTIGAGFASGEMTAGELSETLLDIVDSHVRTLNQTALPTSGEELRNMYYTKGVSTPLVTIVPSCSKLPFAVNQDRTQFDWSKFLRENMRTLVDDLWTRVDNCGGCLEPFINTMTANFDMPSGFAHNMLSRAREQLDQFMEKVDHEKELPKTLGGIISYAIDASQPQMNSAAAARKSTNISSLAESLVGLLDALNYELVVGDGPLLHAMEQLYKSMGC